MRPNELTKLGIEIQVHMWVTNSERRQGRRVFPKKFGWKQLPVTWFMDLNLYTIGADVYYRLAK